MKLEAVPQDASHYEGHKRLCYATDAEGRTVRALSKGWEVETIVTARAIERLREQVEAAWDCVDGGTRTPLFAAIAERQSNPRLFAQDARLPWFVVACGVRPALARWLPEFVWTRFAHALAWNLEPVLLRCGATRADALAALNPEAR